MSNNAYELTVWANFSVCTDVWSSEWTDMWTNNHKLRPKQNEVECTLLLTTQNLEPHQTHATIMTFKLAWSNTSGNTRTDPIVSSSQPPLHKKWHGFSHLLQQNICDMLQNCPLWFMTMHVFPVKVKTYPATICKYEKICFCPGFSFSYKFLSVLFLQRFFYSDTITPKICQVKH